MVLLAAHSEAATWCIQDDLLRGMKASLAMGQSGPWLCCTTNVNRDNGKGCEDLVDDLRHRHSLVRHNMRVCSLSKRPRTGR